MTDDTTRVPVAEMFYSLQGEGPHAGTPAVFLRLAGCNLSCGWNDDLADYEQGDDPQGDATWVCDTIDVWRSPEHTWTPRALVDEWADRGWLTHLADGAHIVLTGGEPTLPAHQARVRAVVDLLAERGVEPTVEVETNGTQHLTDEFDACIDQYNVSLKLANSGQPEADRLVEAAIDQYTAMRADRARFKFVVSDDSDVAEVAAIADSYAIPDSHVSLMPAGQDAASLRETYPVVAEACKQRNWQFSPRLHVDIWGAVTGV